MKVEYNGDKNIECNECGVVGRSRYLVWLDHLCKHFVALCPLCFCRLAKELKRRR